MKYILEYENGLQRVIFSKKKLLELQLKVPQEGLRSIACLTPEVERT